MKDQIKTQINLNKSIYMIVYLTYDKLPQADAILQTFFTLTKNNKAILAFVIPFLAPERFSQLHRVHFCLDPLKPGKFQELREN